MNFLETFHNVSPLIPCIATQGTELVGVEVGVQRAESLCTILQSCENVLKIYGVDNWQPYVEEIHEDKFYITQEDSEWAKLVAYHNIKWSGYETKVEIIEKESTIAVNDFGDDFFDFIFLDSYNNMAQCFRDLDLWYPKLKTGGLFCGHDSSSRNIVTSIKMFREKNEIVSPLALYQDTWCWKKL